MGHLIDRRLNGKNKSAVNRQRFLRRHRGEIRKVVEGNLRRRSIADTESGEKIRIPSRGMHEPVFQHGEGGEFTHVLPGNKEFVVGDRFPRPQSGSGGGRQGSPDGEGLDDFVFEINRQEFLDLLFEDMALPNLTKRQLSGQEAFQYRRAGFSTSGNPSNIDIRRSLKAAVSRRTAMTAGLKRQQRELQQQLDALDDAMAGEGDALTEQELLRVRESRSELQQRLEQVSGRIARMPFLDEFDIHYRRHEKVPVPRSRAVMFCLMDVSGSMDQRTKDLAKRFFILLYLFLSRNYDKVELVFIRHHTRAIEVDEDDFFNARETGGTVVSSALEMMNSIIDARYPVSQWNIYGAQASDGDNWPDDNKHCVEVMSSLLPKLQYYAYIEITTAGDRSLWQSYQLVQAAHPEVFAMRHIKGAEDIYPVFHELFRKQTA